MRHTHLLAISIGLLILLLVPGCIGPAAPPENNTSNQTVCTTVYQPVCGIDNKTYSNDCFAKAVNIQVAYQGACIAPEQCTETDSGQDYSVVGTTTKGSVNKDDRCVDSSNLLEYYCANNDIMNETVKCQDGYECSVGKCVIAVPKTGNCTDSDKGLDKFTAGKVTYLGKESSDICTMVDTVKEYYCANGTNAVSDTLLNCPLGFECQGGACNEMPSVCSETDSGKDLAKKGSTKIMKGSATIDIQFDKCYDGKILREYFCTGNSVANELVNCGSDSICFDDTCVSLTCQDSDDGADALVAGAVTKGTETYNDYCIDESSVKEYICSYSNIENTKINCPSGYVCSNGACTQTPSCADSDGGKNYNSVGYVTKGSETYPDRCSSGLLTEFYCSGNNVASEVVSCTTGTSCLEGYCG